MLESKMKNAGLVAGIGWLLIIIVGITSEFLIRMPMIDVLNPALTIVNLKESMSLFRLSIILDILMVSLDITVGWALYRILYSTSSIWKCNNNI